MIFLKISTHPTLICLRGFVIEEGSQDEGQSGKKTENQKKLRTDRHTGIGDNLVFKRT